MADTPTLTAALGLAASAAYSVANGVAPSNHNVAVGASGFPELEWAFNYPATLEDLSDQCDWIVSGEGSIDDAAGYTIDLSSSRKDKHNIAVSAAKVKFCVIAIKNPSTGAALVVKPYDTTGAFALGVEPADVGQHSFPRVFFAVNPEGWSRISGSVATSCVRLENESGVDGIEYAYLIGGVR